MIQIEDIVKKIEEDEKPRRDKTVLIMAAKLIYYCALKPGELVDLKIKDVQNKNGEIINDIIIKEKNKTIKLNEDIRSLLQSYIDYLKGKGYGISPNSPLIPQRNHSRYRYRKKLSRHLGKYIEEKKLEKLRQAGIRDYYNTNSNFSEFDKNDDKLEKTARHFSSTTKHMNALLKGKIQPAGKSKAEKILDTLLEIEELIDMKKDIRILKELEILIDIILRGDIDNWSKGFCEKLKNLLEKRMEEVKSEPPEPVKESKGITDHINIDFIEMLKDEIDDPGQD